MKDHGAYLVADICNDDFIVPEYKRMGYPEQLLDKEHKIGQTQRENFQHAVKAGVKVAYGTDAGVYPHGWNGRQSARRHHRAGAGGVRDERRHQLQIPRGRPRT